MIIKSMSLFRIIVTCGVVAAQLTTGRANVEVQFPADLSLAHAQVIAGADQVSLGPGQLWIYRTLHHFGLCAEKETAAGPRATTAVPKVLWLFY